MMSDVFLTCSLDVDISSSQNTTEDSCSNIKGGKQRFEAKELRIFYQDFYRLYERERCW
jgi:hypothetical protein